MVRPRLPKLPKSIEEAAEWYMRYISPLSLVAAFFVDTFFLIRRVDQWTTSLVLFFYLALAATIVIVISLIQTGRLRQPWLLKITPMLPVVAQYAFGGLFIAFLSLYSRSAAFTLSWIFVVVLAVLLIANERFVRFYLRFSFQMSILFTVLFSFLIFYIPVLFGIIGPYIFLASGATSLVVIAGFLYLQFYLTPELVRAEFMLIARSIAAIFVVFNILYFTGAIPPLPLALKEAGVYHDVVRRDNGYRLLGETERWYASLFPQSAIFHRAAGESAYVFTAIFAPAGLSTTIVHEWQRYDESARAWVTEETVPFFIIGGREAGYRGYSVKNDTMPGRWRVNVITEFGQVIGRVQFLIEDVESPVPLEITVQ